MCDVLLPPSVNAIAVKYMYHISNTLRFVVKTSCLMLCREKVATFSESDTEPINAFYEHSVIFSNVMSDGTK
jgi:hypothetical protein